MKSRTLQTKEDLQKASRDLLNLEDSLPLVMTLTKGKAIRSTLQNARYWVEIDEFMHMMNAAVSDISDSTGYTPLEARRVIAAEMEPERAVILFARKPEVVHEVLKAICNIPTSTRLGTKDFMKYEDILSATMMEIIGTINAFRA